jgi:cyclomaltodextrinase
MADLKPGKYRHYKGNDYEVVGVGKHSETLEELVIYVPLYGEGGFWVRPLTMFIEEVSVDGQSVSRFEYMGDVE